MKTLGKSITSQFFNDPETGFHQAKALWKSALDSKTDLTAADHLAYAILRGKDYRKGFGPITNKNKLANGATWAFRAALIRVGRPLKSGVFKDIVTPDAYEIIKGLMGKMPGAYSDNPFDLPEYVSRESALVAA